jgi:hypothetical protein
MPCRERSPVTFSAAERGWDYQLQLLDRRAKAGASTQAVARALDVVTPNTFTTLLVGVSGIVLTTDCGAGFYVLVAAVLLAVGGGVTSAWLLLTKVTG